jgi:hypothetical protein
METKRDVIQAEGKANKVKMMSTRLELTALACHPTKK